MCLQRDAKKQPRKDGGCPGFCRAGRNHFFNSLVQCGHRVALSLTSPKQYVQSLAGFAGAAGAGLRNFATSFTKRKMHTATSRKLMTAWMNEP